MWWSLQSGETQFGAKLQHLRIQTERKRERSSCTIGFCTMIFLSQVLDFQRLFWRMEWSSWVTQCSGGSCPRGEEDVQVFEGDMLMQDLWEHEFQARCTQHVKKEEEKETESQVGRIAWRNHQELKGCKGSCCWEVGIVCGGRIFWRWRFASNCKCSRPLHPMCTTSWIWGHRFDKIEVCKLQVWSQFCFQEACFWTVCWWWFWHCEISLICNQTHLQQAWGVRWRRWVPSLQEDEESKEKRQGF